MEKVQTYGKKLFIFMFIELLVLTAVITLGITEAVQMGKNNDGNTVAMINISSLILLFVGLILIITIMFYGIKIVLAHKKAGLIGKKNSKEIE